MTVRISSGALAQIRSHAAASPALEVCGLLFGTVDRIEVAEACANVAADPARFFEIDPAALVRAHREARAGARQPVGCYHSHPGGRAWPSAADAAMAAGDGWLWLIVAGTEANVFRSTAAAGFEALPLATDTPEPSHGV